eukprot:3554063-Rhodomonas_salina.4
MSTTRQRPCACRDAGRAAQSRARQICSRNKAACQILRQHKYIAHVLCWTWQIQQTGWKKEKQSKHFGHGKNEANVLDTANIANELDIAKGCVDRVGAAVLRRLATDVMAPGSEDATWSRAARA